MTVIEGVDIDLSAPEFWSLPWAERERGYQLLRQHQPLAFFEEPDQIPGLDQPKGPGYRAVVRHADVLEVSRRPATFCSGQGATSVIDMPADLNEFYGSLISMDDPRHARLRRIVSGAFTPRMLQRILDQVEHTAAEVLDGIDRSSVDLVADIAAPFPLLVILDMMGVPRSERGMILESANAILSGGDPDFLPPGKDFLTAILEAGMNLSALMEPLAAARRDVPTDDLVSALIHADVEGEPITDQEVVSFFILLLVAGSETTRTAVSHGVWAFAEHPEQRQIWVDDFDAVAPTAVDEIVRWATPVISMRRTVTEDVTLAGTDLHAGDKLLLMYAAANRDEAVFDNPHTFDVRRSPNPHVGFGGPGPHFCLGAHLARREITVMFRELFRRYPDLTVTDAPAQLQSAFINGIKRLPVDLGR
ncbi:cytochrome P450 [Acidiferrimicrobium sp. IK]|uniref:cytochrome P450 n=1 Tax=Acidiferrimicrobium sp. IK TaxID=2871700 RepID=UPI0021CB2FB7|nr:cytochrome P450 [Acidiferrimicrobium sp. IK]MCU4183973.1 cytochrome P450 [Acidiferrimicrobium sp. IK]